MGFGVLQGKSAKAKFAFPGEKVALPTGLTIQPTLAQWLQLHLGREVGGKEKGMGGGCY